MNNNARLEDIYTFQYGKGNTIESNGGPYPIYGSNGAVGFTDKYNSEDAPVIGHIGAYAGIVNWASGKHFVTYNGVICKVKDGVDPKYGYYALLVSRLQDRVRGSTQPFVSYDLLNEVNIRLVDPPLQRKISAVLSVLDDKIELNRKINAELEQMARTLYDYWFVQFDFPDANGKPYKSSGGQMVYNDQLKRKIPTGWQVLKLQDVLEFEKGTEPGAAAYSETKSGEYDLPFYRVGDIDGETSTYIDSNKFKAKIVKPSDVVVTFDGSVGKMGLGLNGAISGGLRHIYDKAGKISDAAVYAIFGNEYITKTIERYATGSVILHASSSIPYLAIPYDEQTFAVFQEIVEPMFAKIIANRQQSQNLAHLRDWLLPMLMNGQAVVQGSAELIKVR